MNGLNRLLSALLIVSGIWIGRAAAQQSDSLTAERYLITNVDVVDVRAGAVRKNMDVLVAEGRIWSITRTGDDGGALHEEPGTGTSVTEIDGTGKHLVPGLIDSHVHLREPDRGIAVFPGFGVTTVRVMDGSERILELQQQIAAGCMFAPDIVSASPYVEDLIGPGTDVDSLVRDLSETGYDIVKIHDDIAPENYLDLIDAVKRHNAKLVGHVQREQPLEFVLNAGQHEISHGEEFIYTYFDSEVDGSLPADDLVEKVAASGTVVVPNLVFFNGMYTQATDRYFDLISDPDLRFVSPERRAAWIEDSHRFYIDESELPWYEDAVTLLKRVTNDLHDAGVTILAGSDTPLEFMIPGKSLVQELLLFEEAGLSAAEAIRTATIDAAGFMDLTDRGSIEVGHRADLLLIDGNPLEDLRALFSIEGLMLRGTWYDRADIRRRMDVVSDAYHRGEIERQARETTIDLLLEALETSSPEQAVESFRRIDDTTDVRLLGEAELNDLGYRLLDRGQVDDAVTIFHLNTRLYQESANVWDSLGEAYRSQGRDSLSIRSYEKALSLDPELDSSRRALDELGGNGRR